MRPVIVDPLRKREEFAISLRKQKKDKIIRDRRKRMMMTSNSVVNNGSTNENDLPAITRVYHGCTIFSEENKEGTSEISLVETIKRIIPDYPTEEVDEDEEEKLEAFEGSPSKAFETMVAKQLGSQAARAYGSGNPFMLLDKMLEKKVDLCDDTDTLPFPQEMTVTDIFPALYGAQSDLFRRFHERRNDTDLNFSPPHPFSAEGVSWASVATLACRVPIPILGIKPYKEIQRLVLCRQGEEITLAVQTVGKVVAGWYGEFVSENVYFFSQPNSKAPIRFKAITPAPTGTFAKSQLDGAKKSLSDFVTVAKEILQDWSANTPSSNAQRRCSNGTPDESPTKGNVPARAQASVILPARPASEPALGWFTMCSCDMPVSGDGELVVVHDK